MTFKGRDLISIRDFSKEEIYHILDVAKGMVPIAKGEKHSNLLKDHILGSFFFEPSTRTRLSFESAMHRLSGKVINISGVEGTSLVKGESLADTIRMADMYSDVIVLRHPHEGAGRLAALHAVKPVINGGDGAGQHPTQTLLDLFTIQDALGKIEGQNVALVGDLKFGRTVHSLSYALALLGANIFLVAPPQLQMPKESMDHLAQLGHKPVTCERLDDVVSKLEVIYMTRIQKERFDDPTMYTRMAKLFTVNNEVLKNAKEHLVVMHPLPRVDEIHTEVDSTQHAWYFKQAFNGVPVRMAILALLTGVVE